MQLERDSQEKIQVEGVVMRYERPRGRSTGDRLHGRGFHLDESFFRHCAPERCNQL
jgi:hypothetical protein